MKAIEEANIVIKTTFKLSSSSSNIKYEKSIANKAEKNNRKKNEINAIIGLIYLIYKLKAKFKLR